MFSFYFQNIIFSSEPEVRVIEKLFRPTALHHQSNTLRAWRIKIDLAKTIAASKDRNTGSSEFTAQIGLRRVPCRNRNTYDLYSLHNHNYFSSLVQDLWSYFANISTENHYTYLATKDNPTTKSLQTYHRSLRFGKSAESTPLTSTTQPITFTYTATISLCQLVHYFSIPRHQLFRRGLASPKSA